MSTSQLSIKKDELETRAFSTGPVENACIKLLKPLNLEVIVLQCEFLTSYPKVSLDF